MAIREATLFSTWNSTPGHITCRPPFKMLEMPPLVGGKGRRKRGKGQRGRERERLASK